MKPAFGITGKHVFLIKKMLKGLSKTNHQGNESSQHEDVSAEKTNTLGT
jgi:hypothetical protein